MKIIPPRTELDLHPLANADWNYATVPPELASLVQWKHCYIEGTADPQKPTELITTAKRPVNGPKVDFVCDTFSNVVKHLDNSQFQHFGFCFSEDDEYIGIDVDNLPLHFQEDDIPSIIKSILLLKPTYAELSPSGQGLHVIYKTDKSFLAHRAAADKGVDGFSGAIYLRDQFLTWTGHTYTPLSKPASQITYIEPDLLEKMLMKPTNIHRIKPPTPPPTAHSIAEAPTIAQMRNWLTRIPATLSGHKLREIFWQTYRTFTPPLESPPDYEHWRIIAAAVHHGAALAGQIHEGAELFDEWSSYDQVNYPGSEAAQQKYYDNPPKYDETDITYLTLARLYHAARPQWPYPKVEGRGKEKKINHAIPEQSNIQNWNALFQHMGLQLGQNEITKTFEITGNEQAIAQYFNRGKYNSKEGLESAVHYFGQDNFFTTASGQIAKAFTRWWTEHKLITFNPIKRWIDNAPDYNPGDGSYFQALWETIILPDHERGNEELYRTYLKKALMGVIRAHYYTGKYSATTGIVILQGPEQTFKSTWVRQLLPLELSKEYLIPSQARADRSSNIKELQLEAGVAQIWLKDEVEELLRSGDAVLKNFLVQETDAYRPLYGQTPIQVPRKCIFFGTTNEPELPITDNGARRIQIIPIKQCDTTSQSDLNIVMVYKELLHEFNNTPDKDKPSLWVLSTDEISATNSINASERKADQEADILLKETYRYDQPFDLANFLNAKGNIDYRLPSYMTMTAVIADIRLQTGTSLTMAAIKRALRRVNGQWIGKNIIKKDRWSIEYGFAKYRSVGGKVSKSGWLMPPKTMDFIEEVSDGID